VEAIMTATTHGPNPLPNGTFRAIVGALLAFEVASIAVPALGLWLAFRMFAG